MLRRLFLALLIACLAVPALAGPMPEQGAPCHEAMAAMPGMAHHQPAPAQGAARHECIGCATIDLRLPVLASATLPGPFSPVAGLTVLAMRATTGPDLPPPRA